MYVLLNSITTIGTKLIKLTTQYKQEVWPPGSTDMVCQETLTVITNIKISNDIGIALGQDSSD